MTSIARTGVSRRVLVCGGRDYRNWIALQRSLDALHEVQPIAAVIQGGAQGADKHARDWAKKRRVTLCTYDADWQAHGKAAGPIRNQHMLQDSQPDLVLAAPGGKGTADMVRRARAAGVPVIEMAP